MGEQPDKGSQRSGKKGRREAHIDVRMTYAQKDAITRKAESVGLDPSTWLRTVGLEHCEWNPAKDEEFKAARAKKLAASDENGS